MLPELYANITHLEYTRTTHCTLLDCTGSHKTSDARWRNSPPNNSKLAEFSHHLAVTNLAVKTQIWRNFTLGLAAGPQFHLAPLVETL